MSLPLNHADLPSGVADEGHNLSEADRKLLEVAITCLKTPPELDIQKLAEKLGVKPKTVTNRWCDLKKKLFANEGTASPSERAPRTPVKKRKGEAQGGSAAKKVTNPRASKNKATVDQEEGDGDNGN